MRCCHLDVLGPISNGFSAGDERFWNVCREGGRDWLVWGSVGRFDLRSRLQIGCLVHGDTTGGDSVLVADCLKYK